MSFALLACLIIYYLETQSPVLPALVPFAHLTFVAILFLLLPRVAFPSPFAVAVKFVCSQHEMARMDLIQVWKNMKE